MALQLPGTRGNGSAPSVSIADAHLLAVTARS
jgi:hypothetical protein